MARPVGVARANGISRHRAQHLRCLYGQFHDPAWRATVAGAVAALTGWLFMTLSKRWGRPKNADMRDSEIKRITWVQFDTSNGVITVGRSKTAAGEGNPVELRRYLDCPQSLDVVI